MLKTYKTSTCKGGVQVTDCASVWLSPWMAAGSCGWANDASGSTGGGCGAAGRTAPAGALRGCQPHCWSPALSETAMCLNLIRHSDPTVSQCRVKLKSLVTWKVCVCVGGTYSVLWPWLQTEAWWGSVSAGGCDGNCGCLSTCWLEEVLHLNLKSEEKSGKWNYTAILLLSCLVLAEYSTKPEHLLCKFMFKVKQMLLLNKQQAWCWLSSDSFERRCSCVTHVVPQRKKNGKK